MKHLLNFFAKSSISKMFFCFPDPHFKKANYRRRIITYNLLCDYSYVLEKGGKIYAITDVLKLHEWHLEQLEKHPLFQPVPEEENQNDPCVEAIIQETEEGKKVARNQGKKYYCVYRKI